MKKLSIVTVNKNNSAGLQKTLESVSVQTFKDFEHIVIDGASNDGSIDVIKKFPHIAYYESEPDNGIYFAMNKGVEKSTGEYCLFLNSGDYLVDGKVLEKVFNFDLSEDIVYGDCVKKGMLRKAASGHLPITLFYKLSPFMHGCSFIKKSLLSDMKGYRTDFSIASDFAFFVEAWVVPIIGST
jgi:glycosyltransferase involved in cell wall biosynthesis